MNEGKRSTSSYRVVVGCSRAAGIGKTNRTGQKVGSVDDFRGYLPLCT